MKVLHINSYYSESRFFKNLYDKQIANGVDINVFVPVAKGANYNEIDFGKYTDISYSYNKNDRYIFNIKHNKIYEDLINKYNITNYDIIHAHSLFSNGFIALKMKKEFNIPYIVAVRNTDVNIFFKYMINLRRIGIEILNEADKIVFLSESYKNIVINKYTPKKYRSSVSAKSEVIPNGVDDFWIDNKNTIKRNPPNKSVKFVYAGDINKNKNILMTSKALNLLKNSGYDIEFVVVGKILDRSVYRKLCNNSYVQYIEYIEKTKLIEIYRQSDIFIMPSKYESFGIVYVEAMSQGLPIIYTKNQGFDKQFINGEVGYSVESSSYNDIESAIKQILSDYRNISDKCVKGIDKFSWEKISSDYSVIYDEVYKSYHKRGI